VNVDVHHVEARFPGLEAAHYRVEVRPIHVSQRAHGVNRLEQLAYSRLEQAKRRRFVIITARVADPAPPGRRRCPLRRPERTELKLS